MELNPRNDREEMEWTERDKSVQAENQEIIHTLEKVRPPYYICFQSFISL
jgi:hypothetical protein